ncbi:MAG: lipoate--protein ligase [Chitinophagales bacterium]
MILVNNRGSNNPYINLAIEEYLVRHCDCSKGDYLLLYVNDPCIVVGKNQSIYREVNFDYLRNDRLQLCRRISGGGTVYHDPGNLSFAFISQFADNKVNNYRYFNRPIIEALNKADFAVEHDARNNIICNGKKISGNAQFTDRKNIISHGTLLYNADLNTLRACLKPNNFEIDTKAVASVSSSVINLYDVKQVWSDIGSLQQYLSKELAATEVMDFTNAEWEEIEKLAAEKFSQAEWIYGRSPKTIIRKNEVELVIEEGRVTEVKGVREEVRAVLAGVFYTYTHIKKALSVLPNASVLLNELF